MKPHEDRQPPIGGYFELELPLKGEILHAELSRFQSARAAFLALLRVGRPAKVWIPKLICNAMLKPIENARINYEWYDLTENFDVSPDVKIGDHDWLLYVNYFGIFENNITALMQRYPPSQIVLDYSQAFFLTPHKQALATIYSPRKFFGMPDGGLLHSRIMVPYPDEIDSTSIYRTEHLIRRLSDSPETGYSAYQKAEESLANIEPKSMSCLSERILASINFESVRRKRTENFRMLHDMLGGSTSLIKGIDKIDAPLCYPYQTTNNNLRKHLIANKIFVATYWNDAADRLSLYNSDKFIKNTIPLPIDQRYGIEDMKRIAATIKNLI